MEVLIEIAKSSPGIAVAGLSVWAIYRLADRLVDSLDANTKALSAMNSKMVDRSETDSK